MIAAAASRNWLCYWAPFNRCSDGHRNNDRSGQRFSSGNSSGPRRQSILAIAEDNRRAHDRAYREQYETREQTSQRDFRAEIHRIVIVAFFIGVVIAAGT